MPKVSVIIPVYNVEKYLKQCLDSIIHQTLKDIEIICINDGSTDKSLEVLRKYEKQDKRIKVLSQKNSNAGAVRNKGIGLAKGEYLSFLDGDDFFNPNMLKSMYDKAKSTNSDIVVCAWNNYDNKLKKVTKFHSIRLKKTTFTPTEMKNDLLTFSKPNPWSKLFKRDLFIKNNLKFEELMRCNDITCVCTALTLANKISTINTPYINYRSNQKNNLSAKRGNEHFDCFVLAINKLYENLVKFNKFTTFKKTFIKRVTDSLKRELKFCNNKEESDNLIKKLMNKNLYKILYKVDPPAEEEQNKIPKRIFYVWGANEIIRPEVQACIDTWKKFMPDYEIVQIDENSKKYFNFEQELKTNKWFRTVYERKMWANVADYVRVKTLYENGGIYFDTDVSVVQNIDKFLDEPAFVGIQSSSLDGSGDWVEPAICGAQKKNKFFEKVVSFYDKLIWEEPIYTIPHIFNYYLREYKNIFPFKIKSEQEIIKLPDITIYPERYFIPYRFRSEFTQDCIEADTHTIHHWGGSWVKPEIIHFLKNKHLSNAKMSVIVCAYNNENYIAECLDSLVNQTLKDIQIICVNDGSTDGTLSVMEKYAQKDDRINVISHKNCGLATSRNKALKIIRGEYCAFIDGDDYIDSNALLELYEYAHTNKLDMLAFSGYNFDKTNKEIINPYWSFSYLPKGWNKKVFTYKECLPFMHEMAVSSCLTVYRSDFILSNRLTFPDGLVYEDNVFWTKAFTNNAKFGILNKKFYKRRLHEESITHNWKKNIKDWIKISEIVLEHLKAIKIDKKTFDNYKNHRIKLIKERFKKLKASEKNIVQKDVNSFIKKYEHCSYGQQPKSAKIVKQTTKKRCKYF